MLCCSVELLCGLMGQDTLLHRQITRNAPLIGLDTLIQRCTWTDLSEYWNVITWVTFFYRYALICTGLEAEGIID